MCFPISYEKPIALPEEGQKIIGQQPTCRKRKNSINRNLPHLQNITIN